MQFGGAMAFTTSSISAMELAHILEERGFEVDLGPRALAHPSHPQDTVSGR